MMRVLPYFTGLLLAYFMYGFYISQVEFSVIPVELKPENPAGFYDYRGGLNIQSNLSNGSSSPSEIMADAKSVGLDFLIFTDRQKAEAPVATNISGYHGSLLVIDAGEYSYLDSRLLFMNRAQTTPSNDPGAQSIYFTDLLSQKRSANKDSLLILAHPFNPNPTWTGPYPTGLDGIEIINPKSISQKAWIRSKINVLWSFFVYPFNARFSFLRLFVDPTDELSLWDKLTMENAVWGYAGLDANAKAIPLANYLIKFPSYAMSLGTMSNHVLLPTELTGNYAKDNEKIFLALKNGQFYTALDLLGNPKGFIAKIEGKEDSYLMGSRLKYRHGLKLHAELPIEPRDFYEIVVMKNGDRAITSNKQSIDYEIKSPGVYRIEVRVSPWLPLPDGRKWISWIYTNPFFVE